MPGSRARRREGHDGPGDMDSRLRRNGLWLGTTRDADLMADYLRLLSRAEIKGHAACPCGSGLRLRNCHIDRVLKLREQICPSMAKRMLARIAPK